MMRDTDAARRNLMALEEIGVSLALDDFGTGYSSLTYLEQFPIDIVKIDKTFVASIGPDQAPLARDRDHPTGADRSISSRRRGRGDPEQLIASGRSGAASSRGSFSIVRSRRPNWTALVLQRATRLPAVDRLAGPLSAASEVS